MEAHGLSAELYNTVVAISRYSAEQLVKEIKVTREDFNRLEERVEEIVKAQLKTDESIRKLTEAQARTEARLDRVETAIERLAEAQARTDESIKKLFEAQARTDESIKKLFEAQARTEARLDRVEAAIERLAEAQARSEARLDRVEAAIERLAEAQAKTEAVLKNLATEVKSLSDNFGFGLEDIAHVVLPGYLERHYGIQMGEFERVFFPVDGGEVEVNLYGTGKRNGEEVTILGECKSRIYEREVKKFMKDVKKVASQIKTELVKVMFGYLIHPSASKAAQDEGIILVASYQK